MTKPDGQWPEPGKVQRVAREESRSTELAPGFVVANHVDVWASDYHGYDVHAVVRMVDERLVVTDLSVHRTEDGEPVTGDGLRQIPMTSIRKMGLMRTDRVGEPPASHVAYGLVPTADRDRLRDEGPTTGTLELVAAIYRAAYAVGDRPNKAVQETFGLPRSTSDNWIRRARDRGLLGAAGGAGKAGV